MKPIAVDLFCGAGGISEGILQAGFHIAFSNEINKEVSETYRKRHEQLGIIQGKNTWLEIGDIKNISGKYILEKIKKLENFNGKKNIEIDAIFGGPPCQGFSRAGKQKKNDKRNFLFLEYLRIINEIKPKYIIFENVPGILDIKFEKFFSCFDNQKYINYNAIEIIKNEIKKIGYEILNYKILNAADFGVPQNRQRLILIGYKKGEEKPSYPEKNNEKVTLEEAIGDIAGYDSEKKNYQIESKKGRTKNIITGETIGVANLFNNEKSRHYQYIKERFSILKEGESNSQLKKRLKKEGINIKQYPALLEYIKNKSKLSEKKIIDKCKDLTDEEILNLIVSKKNSRIKLKLKETVNTVLTLPDDLILPDINRICSVRELARLQSFDDSFVFYGKRTTGGKSRKYEVPQYTQVGNAVPPLMAKAIATEIIKVLVKNKMKGYR